MPTSRTQNRQIVEVRWIDSCTTPGWSDEEDLQKSLDEHTFANCVSVGFMFRDDDEYLALVMSYNDQDNIQQEAKSQAETLLIIPKSCIKSVTQLRRRG